MCLKNTKQIKTRDKNKTHVGYKVFIVSKHKKTIKNYICSINTSVNKWIKARNLRRYSTLTLTYKPGFHIFKTKTAAELLVKDTATGQPYIIDRLKDVKLVVKKVLYKNPYISGEYKTSMGKSIIAEYIFIQK